MAHTLDEIQGRVTSIVTRAPFSFGLSADPDSFTTTPTTAIDGSCYVGVRTGRTSGALGLYEVRVDQVDVYVARRVTDPLVSRRLFYRDIASLSAAVIRDGAIGGGDYAVEDSRTYDIKQPKGADYGILRLTLPVNYEAAL